MTFYREHRLIAYRPSRRTIRKNADAQKAKRAQSLSSQRGTVQRKKRDEETGLRTGELETVGTMGPQTTTKKQLPDGTFVESGGPAALDNLAKTAQGSTQSTLENPLLEQNRTGFGTAVTGTEGGIESQNARRPEEEGGFIDETAVKRLMGLNPDGSPRILADGTPAPSMTEAEARAQVQANRPDVQEAFDNVGRNRTARGNEPEERMGEAERALRRSHAGGYMDPIRLQEARAADAEVAAAEAKKTAAETEAENARTTSDTEPEPEAQGMGAAFANLPPEAQFLAPYLQEFQETMQESLEQNAQMTQGLLDQQTKTFDSIDTQISDMREGYQASTEAIQGLLEDAREQNEQYLAKQQKAQEEKLAWDEYKQRREITKQKREAHDSMVAQIALAGGFGQDAGMRAVMESDEEYNSKLSDLATEYSFARTDLVAKFSGMYLENQHNYINGTVSNMKELRSSLERIGMQSIGNQQARLSAQQTLMQNAWTNQTNLRTTLATQNLNVAGQMASMAQQERANKLAQLKLENDIDWREYVFEQEMDYKRDALADRQATGAADDIAKFEKQAVDRMDRERNRIASRVDGDKVIQEADSVDVRFDNMESVYRRSVTRQEQYDNGEIDKKSMNATDQTLINTFNKTLDETSVVREGEYERSIDGLAFMEKIEAKLRKINEGGVLTPDERKEIFEVTQTLQKSWQSKKNERLQRYYSQIDSYNMRAPEEYQLTPEEFGLPANRTTTKDRSELDDYLPQTYSSPHAGPNPFSNSGETIEAPAPSLSSQAEIKKKEINGKTISAQPYILEALEKADAELFAATGNHIQVNQHFRSPEQQAALYKKLSAKGARVAPPGKSFHEKGLAIDVTNWEEAQPYLAKYGIVNGLPGDMGHFSIGEMNPEIIATFSKPSTLAYAGIQ